MPDLEQLLISTSRTFAMAIPYLPEPTRQEVTLSYLLFRVADTFEDAAEWPRAARVEALGQLEELLRDPEPLRIAELSRFWAAEVPCTQPGYTDLLAELPAVFEALLALPPEAVGRIRVHTLRTARGMAEFVERIDDRGELALHDLAELRAYCYVVAGIVGELLTELFLLDSPGLAAVAAYLRDRAIAFGEGLQLVNILKDSATDAGEGRRYLPAGVERAEVLELARRNLAVAAQYVSALQENGAPRGFVSFTALPVHLAFATLDRVEQAGPGSKLTRPEVYALVRQVDEALDRNQPVLPGGRFPAAAPVLPPSVSSV
jgi:farnesyl-diphosphate farnesyltransferase